MVCGNCRVNDVFEFDPVPLPTSGKLLTFTIVHNLPAEYEVPRLGLGMVELDNGVRITGQLEVDDPRIGMPVEGSVEVVRHEAYQDFYGMVFRAV